MRPHRPPTGLLTALAVTGLATAAAIPTEEGGPWTTESLKHRAIEDFDFALGRTVWRNLDSEIELFGVAFPVDFLGPMHLEIDSNGDETPDEDVKGAFGFVDLKGETDDGEVFHYGVRFKNEGDRKWSWAAAGAMVGKVNGTVISVIDADANGSYDDYGVDGLVIGSHRGAGYVSRIVNIDGELFEFDISEDGTEVKTRPWTGETGTLQLDKPEKIKAEVANAIFRLKKDVSFELANVKGALTVPVGEYEFAAALLERRAESARVRGGRREPVEVAAGAEVTFEWGGPLTAEAPTPTIRGGKATLSPSLKIFGDGGEEYYDFQPTKVVPSFEIKDAETGKRLEKGRFPAG
ncbi:MAG: hypothetical protein AAGA20_17515 [Planctomycetota bacterium]